MKSIFLILFSVIACVLNAQTATEKVTWDYPVRYGTPEWETLNTFQERLNAFNIPDEIIKNISTEELVKVCLSYPWWGLIDAYNDRRTGFGIIVGYFNGFRELFRRTDAATQLLKEYDKMDPLAVDPEWTDLQKGLYCFQFEKIEMFLSKKPMIRQLDEEGVRRLTETVLSKYQKKRMLPEIYSLYNLSPTVAVCLNIIEKENSELLNNRYDVNMFRNTVMSNDIRFLDAMVELLKKKD